MTPSGLYRMLIIDELKGLKQKFINNSSLKEQVFYQFLVNEPLNYSEKDNLTEIEQICLYVFSPDIPLKRDLTYLIEAHRKKQPIRGMHYRNNLIELSAMARDNIKSERKNLKLYCEKCSTRDFYILNYLFPNISSNMPQPQGAIDQIALHLCESNFPQKGWKPLLLKALYETSDLIDFYVVEKGFQRAMDDNPIVHRVNEILYVRNTLVQIVEKIEHRFKLTTKILSVLLLVSISCWLVPLIIRKWDEAEPIMAAAQFLFYLIGILLIVFIGFIPDRIKIFNMFRERVINWVFRKKGFNRLELKETLDRLANQSDK